MRLVADQSIRVAYLTEAYLLAGRMDDAIQFARRALDLSRNHKERGNEAWVLRLLGESAAHHDPPDAEAAESHYRQAMALASELGMRPLLGHCHLGLGRLQSRTGDRSKARENLMTAATMYREMGIDFWLAQAEAELAKVQ
jgi:tetratricopeptide (TPR) repeat protein